MVLAFDGWDWSLSQRFVDAGSMPFFSRLIEAGACGRLRFPPPHSAESAWTTVATGVLADRHGILHPCEAGQGGLRVSAVRSGSIRVATLWQRAREAGIAPVSVGWPVSYPVTAEGGIAVAHGVQCASGSRDQIWPLAPGSVHPTGLRPVVKELRIHPSELRHADAMPLLAALRPDDREALAEPLLRAFAECATVHAIGTCLAERQPWNLLTVRFDLLARVTNALRSAAAPSDPDHALRNWYGFVDLMCGRYMHLAGPAARYVVLSNGTLFSDPQRTGVRLDVERTDTGMLVIAGPGIAKDRLVEGAEATDVLPTLLHMMGIPIPTALEGVVLTGVFADSRPPSERRPMTTNETLQAGDVAVGRDTQCASGDWLESRGYPLPDLSDFGRMAFMVEAETLFALAEVKAERGEAATAIAVLRGILDAHPAAVAPRILLAELLLELGWTAECRDTVSVLPLVAGDPAWADAAYGIIAFGENNLAEAEQRFKRLLAAGPAPIDAATWLGWVRLEQGNWQEAEASFRAAGHRGCGTSRTWEGLGIALFNLKRYRESAAAFGRAIALKPNGARLYLRRGVAYQLAGDHERGMKDLWKALAIDPQLKQAPARLARSMMMRDCERSAPEQGVIPETTPLLRGLLVDPDEANAVMIASTPRQTGTEDPASA